MTWLITGGAGYIGAHVVVETIRSGRSAVVLDDLSTGIKERVPDSVPLEVITLTDKAAVNNLFDRYSFSGVLHLAAKKQVGESVERPDYYWEQNVDGLQNLVDAMVANEVKNFVFSSSAAVYGQPELGPLDLITENTKCTPINPYGLTKLEGENIADKLVANHGFKVAALRYFNVAGAGKPELGDQFALNLIPIVFEALKNGKQPQVFGDDYPTPDGSCIRDYVHVQDLAEAHVAAMTYVENSDPVFSPINIGTGIGASVFEVLAMIEEVTGIQIEAVRAPRRSGDPAALVADVTLAQELLKWKSNKGLETMISSAWEALHL
jgi:UDP-glucose 4-epimerase